MHLVVYETGSWTSFAPLTFTRPVFSLHCGTTSLLQRLIRYCAPRRMTLWVRDELADFVRQRVVPQLPVPADVNLPLDDSPALLVYGGMLHHRTLDPIPLESAYAGDGQIFMAHVRQPGLSHADALGATDRWKDLADLAPAVAQGKPVAHLWDLLAAQEEALSADFAYLKQATTPAPTAPPASVHVVNPGGAYLAGSIRPGAVIDASKGPVIIDAGSIVGSNSVIEGPCHIGAGAIITPLALIRPNTSIGSQCKVGGEISSVIIIGHSNKAHDGFLGDSYLGEWINLGAATVTSNLKNTYGSISLPLPGGEIDTGRQFLGSLIGDHTKTAIGTRLMCGSYIGAASMIATSAIPPRFVPSFSFLTDKGHADNQLDKMLQVAKAVYARRQRQLSEVDQNLIRYAQATSAAMEQPNRVQ